ncbi:MAG: iron chelate uptake ABC transporter family permease subunit, partial [Leptolyngbyaceae cyanobacterium SM2_5_2]|nr:iron chelate uptake ABC transporter family permease subunit [Leptolyngbyaceae cyanobacterium SM2_5_2]
SSWASSECVPGPLHAPGSDASVLESDEAERRLAGRVPVVRLDLPVELEGALAVLGVTALMTSVTVALTGAIGFVGLVTPHVVRALAGGDNRRLLPLSALAGAILLVLIAVVLILDAVSSRLRARLTRSP